MTGSTTARGYGWAYQQARRRILGPSGKGLLLVDPPCFWQGPNCTRVATTADHYPPLRETGRAHLNLVPSCRRCNYGWNRRQPKQFGSVHSREW